ncbi:helix-turn-helix domain-containing protein [Salegentibacter sp. UBA1130]|uniref:helix-turn-helix domain-containing protein n=1 Tax=Salegentibacter sp. UBA1130 TaxID=1947451 RepID=UPI00257A7340|nr:helix-turn-helix transcriptional regulator [Salegentibacter sp. UBA1130]
MELLRIKELLKQKGITGKEFAEQLGISPVAMSNIASGNSFPRPELLLKIAENFDVDLKELFVSTKVNQVNEAVYRLKDGKYIEIGSLDLSR